MKFEPWQAPLLVTAVIILLEWPVWRLLRRRHAALTDRKLGAVALTVLGLSALSLLVVVLGPSLADQLASVSAAVSGLVGLALAYRASAKTTIVLPPAQPAIPPDTPVTPPPGTTASGTTASGTTAPPAVTPRKPQHSRPDPAPIDASTLRLTTTPGSDPPTP